MDKISERRGSRRESRRAQRQLPAHAGKHPAKSWSRASIPSAPSRRRFKHVKNPPRVWVQAGAVGFYGDTGDRLCDESSPAGNDALAGVCKIWEDAFNSADAPKTRKVLLRIGFVLGRDGGALPVLSQAHEKISRRSRGQRQAIHQLDSHRGFDADVCRKHRAGKIVRHVQRGRPQSGDEQVFHARTAPRAASAVESARAGICRAAGRAVDEKRTVARADQPVLRADPVYRSGL